VLKVERYYADLYCVVLMCLASVLPVSIKSEVPNHDIKNHLTQSCLVYICGEASNSY